MQYWPRLNLVSCFQIPPLPIKDSWLEIPQNPVQIVLVQILPGSLSNSETRHSQIDP